MNCAVGDKNNFIYAFCMYKKLLHLRMNVNSARVAYHFCVHISFLKAILVRTEVASTAVSWVSACCIHTMCHNCGYVICTQCPYFSRCCLRMTKSENHIGINFSCIFKKRQKIWKFRCYCPYFYSIACFVYKLLIILFVDSVTPGIVEGICTVVRVHIRPLGINTFYNLCLFHSFFDATHCFNQFCRVLIIRRGC